MSTGYTNILDDSKTEVTLKQFIWRCLGAFYHSAGSEGLKSAKLPPPDLSYHEGELAKANKRLALLDKMTDAQCKAAAKKRHDDKVRSLDKHAAENLEISLKYAAMKTRVKAWKPPTEKHKALKDFMLEQLEIGKPYDNSDLEEVELLAGQEWWKSEKIDALRDIDYHTKEIDKRLACHVENQKYLDELVKSVGEP